MKSFALCAAILAALLACAHGGNPANPLLFVTQVPMPEEVNSRVIAQSYMSCVSPFSNHLADTAHAARGGSLFVRFANAQVVDLLAVADWSAVPGGKPALNSLAVRNPSVNWTADKAIFSMVIGKPASATDPTTFLWQLYEITLPTQAQLLANVKPVLTQVANQPASNNIFPSYGLGGKILFSSDRAYNGQAHLTQREEYLGLPTVSGIWSLDPANAGSLLLLHHSPSGAFSPMVDSVGRVIFTNWDHLDRDPEAVTDSRIGDVNYGENFAQTFNGSGNYPDENAASSIVPIGQLPANTWDIFPEPRSFDRKTLAVDFQGKINGNAFNIFMPWMINPDGTGGEILNHVGRHEVAGTSTRSFTGDGSIVDLNPGVNPNYGGIVPHNFFNNLLWTREDPLNPGVFFGSDAADLGTHGAGQIVKLNNAGTHPDGSPLNPDGITVTYVTPGTHNPKPVNVPTVKGGMNQPATGAAALTAANAEQLYRTPVPLADGNLVASYAAGITQTDYNSGTVAQPVSYYTFRLISLKNSGAGTPYVPDVTLTTGITINTSYYVGSTLVSYNGTAWELDPAEVAPRNAPAAAASAVDPIEAGVFAANGVDIPTFRNYLVQHNAALSVSRDVTRRDLHDRQQPFNLNVTWSGKQALGNNGTVYNIAWQQFFQADVRRGYTLGGATPVAGRRVVATPLHDTMSENVATQGAPTGSVRIGDDGSVAAILPAGKALTWHLLDNDAAKTSQVKERFWVTFQRGEIRSCANCHGINTSDQTGTLANPVTKPTNPPLALAALLQQWKGLHPPGAMKHRQSAVTVLKNAGSAVLTVQRLGGSTGPVSVNFATVNGSAVAGQDFTATGGTVLWLDGDSADKTITIPLLNNPTVGASKSLTVTLSNPVYGSISGVPTATLTVAEPPFGVWQLNRFAGNANNPAIAGPTADFDGDGRANLLEYAGNTDPTKFEAAPPESVFTEVDPIDGHTYLTLQFKRRLPPRDLTYHVETTIDLSTWKEGTPDVSELSSVDDGNGITETVKARATAPVDGSLQRYLRLRLTQP